MGDSKIGFPSSSKQIADCLRYKPRTTALGFAEGIKTDKCEKTVSEKQSVGPGRYVTRDFYGHCDVDQNRECMLRERGNTFWNGYGYAMDCNVDNDSKLRNEFIVTNPNLIHQLFTRADLTTPYQGRGTVDPDMESFLRSGYQTAEKKPCNVLSEVSIDPERMVYTLWNCVQEHAIEDFDRVGRGTRNDVRRAMFNARCVGFPRPY